MRSGIGTAGTPSLADRMVKGYDLIAVEAFQIRNMTRRGKNKHGLNRAIAEQGWRDFFDILNCRAGRAGIPFIEVPPAGASRDCSRCETRVSKALPVRVDRCCVCRLELDRNENPVRNVLRRGLRIHADTVAAGGTA